MVSLVSEFQQIFITYHDVRQAHPDWGDRAIEDYLSVKRDLVNTADNSDSTLDQTNNNSNQIADLVGRVNKNKAVNSEQNLELLKLFNLVAGLGGDVGKLRAITNKLQQLSIDDKMQIAALNANDGKLKAMINSLERTAIDNNMHIAQLDASNGKLRATINNLTNKTTTNEHLLAALQ